jgi:hypothetical protein
MEGRLFRPFCLSPRDNDIANAESVSVLGSEMLNNAFKAVKAGITLTPTPIAQEKLFTKLFS